MTGNGWTTCTVDGGVVYAFHVPCRRAFIVPQEHVCSSPPSGETAPWSSPFGCPDTCKAEVRGYPAPCIGNPVAPAGCIHHAERSAAVLAKLDEQAAARLDRMSAWSDRLWAEAERVAAGQDGAAVVRALAEASRAVWAAGLDHAFAAMRAELLEDEMSLETATAFDATWLSVFVVTLHVASSPPPADRPNAR
jgi:hypothetical protein